MTEQVHCGDCGHLEQEHAHFGRRRCKIESCGCPTWDDETKVEMAKPE